MALTLEQVRQKPYLEQLKIFKSDNDLYNQEMYRVQNILKTRPDYSQGLKHYSVLSAVGAGIDPIAATNGTADITKYQYNPNATPGWNPPTIPEIPDYTSKYGQQIDDILSNINNKKPFNYDPENDPAFQAYMGTYEAKGQTAFNNQLGSMAAASGGRVSSWASSAASGAQNAYIQQGMAAVPQFMNAAYQQYRDSTTDQYNQLNTIMSLDDKDFNQYQQKHQNDYDFYNAQLDQYKSAIDFKVQQFNESMERTKTNGYVSNEDALVLGMKPGTPSYEATTQAQEKQTWLEQQAKQLENEKELIKTRYEYDKKLIGARAGASGGSATSKVNEADFNKYYTPAGKILDEYSAWAYGDKYDELPDSERQKKEQQYVKRLDQVMKSLAGNKYIEDPALEEIYNQIQLSDFYQNVYLRYKGNEESSIDQSFKQNSSLRTIN